MKIIVLYNSDHKDELEHHKPIVRAAEDIRDALKSCGHSVSIMGVDLGDIHNFIDDMKKLSPDLIFNCVESLSKNNSGETLIPALLDSLRIPYTGSSAKTLELCLNKNKVKQLLTIKDIKTPEGYATASAAQPCALPFPVIVKPIESDGSNNIFDDSVVHNDAEYKIAVQRILDNTKQSALIEEFIGGIECYTSILGGNVLPIREVDFTLPDNMPQIITYDAKHCPTSQAYLGTFVVQSNFKYNLRRKIESVAKKVAAIVGVKDYCRIDFRIKDGVPYVIDINANNGITIDSCYHMSAEEAGYTYAQMLDKICSLAIERNVGSKKSKIKIKENELIA